MMSELITHKDKNYVLTWEYFPSTNLSTNPAKIHTLKNWDEFIDMSNCIVGKLHVNDLKEDIGQIVLQFPNKICMLAIKPDKRNDGLGSMLLNRAESIFHDQFRVRKVALTPQSENLKKFYEDRGYFQTDKVFQDGRIEYKKDLTIK